MFDLGTFELSVIYQVMKSVTYLSCLHGIKQNVCNTEVFLRQGSTTADVSSENVDTFLHNGTSTL